MVREQRFNFILDKLKNNGEVGFGDLSVDLNVSEDTIRRDIETLANNGLLLKIRGGAIPRSHNPLSFRERIGQLQDDKTTIALKAQTLIKPGQTIFMDGGTSVYTLVTLLSTDINLTVITNNTAVIPVLSTYKGIDLIVLGGHYLRESETIVGYQANKMAENFQADIFFMGVCAIDLEKGITANYMQEAELKQTMLQHSSTTIALSTFDKLSTSEPFRVGSIDSLDYIITEMDAQNEKFEGYKKAGIKVL